MTVIQRLHTASISVLSNAVVTTAVRPPWDYRPHVEGASQRVARRSNRSRIAVVKL